MNGKRHEKRTEQVFATGNGLHAETQPDASPPPPRQRNWHNAEIICALHLRGSSLAALSRAAGLAPSTLANALYRPWPKGERIIAEFIGTPQEKIWPERYRKE